MQHLFRMMANLIKNPVQKEKNRNKNDSVKIEIEHIILGIYSRITFTNLPRMFTVLHKIKFKRVKLHFTTERERERKMQHESVN